MNFFFEDYHRNFKSARIFFFERGTAERKKGEIEKEKKYDQLSITFTTAINKNMFYFSYLYIIRQPSAIH